MKKIGIVGGVAWPSTVEYYSQICRRCEQWHVSNNLPSVPSTPEMSIESLDINKAASYLGVDGDEESWSGFDNYHRTALARLEAAGVDFALMASNTPHHRFHSILDHAGHCREAGLVHAELGNLRAAIDALERFLALGTEGGARHHAATLLQQLKLRLQ